MSQFNAADWEKVYGSVLYETPIVTPYASISYRIQAKFEGAGKHVNSFSVEFSRKDFLKLIKDSEIVLPVLFINKTTFH
jgi:hypothetical protein